jgi:hypothetical protein
LPFRNSRPLITQTPLLRAIKAYGQLLERDFNPLAKSLLLRTSVPYYSSGSMWHECPGFLGFRKLHPGYLLHIEMKMKRR